MKGMACSFRIKSGKDILHSVDLLLTRLLKIYVKILTFVCFGFEDICHRISFLKTKMFQCLDVCTVHFVEFYFIC